MTLGFSTQIKNKPTYFVEKIWEAILQKGIQINANAFIEYGRKSLPKNYIVGTNKPKLHTIRKDEKNRWKVGNKIHFVTGNRTKERNQFAPEINVKSIQRIDIYKVANVYTPYTYKTKNNRTYQIAIDGNCLNADNMHRIAVNDGFDDLEAFFDWFVEDFSGKIIHWTDYKY